jgi:hypothetical protein
MGGSCGAYWRVEEVGKPEGKWQLGRPRRNGRIILIWIFRTSEGLVGPGWSWFRIGSGVP